MINLNILNRNITSKLLLAFMLCISMKSLCTVVRTPLYLSIAFSPEFSKKSPVWETLTLTILTKENPFFYEKFKKMSIEMINKKSFTIDARPFIFDINEIIPHKTDAMHESEIKTIPVTMLLFACDSLEIDITRALLENGAKIEHKIRSLFLNKPIDNDNQEYINLINLLKLCDALDKSKNKSLFLLQNKDNPEYSIIKKRALNMGYSTIFGKNRLTNKKSLIPENLTDVEVHIAP